MVKICVLQSDNRPTLDYLLKSQKVNQKFCNILEYEYIFLLLDNNKYGNIHPATKKINIVNDFLIGTDYDIIVFLDSDAWIQNGFWLNDIITNLLNNNEKHGCFSRDPYLNYNTFINSGSFIIKNNNFIKKMYNDLIIHLNTNTDYHNMWPFDQYYISNFIFENKDKFIIYVPEILNTPAGKILRHNWRKNQRMYEDLDNLGNMKIEDIYNDKTDFIDTDQYDQETFPNTNVSANEYL